MDKGHKLTDEILANTEREIEEIYKEAQQAAYDRAADYLKKFMKQDSEMKKKLEDGIITNEEYITWRKNKLIGKTNYTAMQDALARDLANSNKLAASIINNHLPDVYAANYNWGTYQIEQGARIDTNFVIYDRQTVERLIRDKPDLLPMKAGVSIPDDIRWNKNQINNAITQGILLGESIPNIAKRLAGVTDMNRKAAIRNARTMTTSAENGGRIDSYKRAEDMGIKITQEWLATKDGRTRHEHAMLDGQEVKVGDPFKVDGYEIMFPGDPTAEPFLVYNCRCTLVSNFKGFDYKKMDNYAKEKPMSYESWLENHEAAKEAQKAKRPVGKYGWLYETGRGFSPEDIEKMNVLVDSAPELEQSVWGRFAPDMKQPLKPVGKTRAYYAPSEGRVHYYREEVSKGDVLHTPFENHFHEYGHNIDHLARERGNFSDFWEDEKGRNLETIIMDSWTKKFGKPRDDAEIISKHVADMITGNMQTDKDHMHGVLKRSLMSYRKANGIERDDARYQVPYSELKECETNKQYLDFYKKYSSILISDEVRRDYGYAVDKDAVKAYIKDMRENYSLQDRGCLSDMMERFTVKHIDTEYPLGAGHGKTYAKTSGSLNHEAFAEMFDSTFANKASLDLIKQELPEAYSAYQQILTEIMNGGNK